MPEYPLEWGWDQSDVRILLPRHMVNLMRRYLAGATIMMTMSAPLLREICDVRFAHVAVLGGPLEPTK